MCYDIHALTIPFACIFVHESLESKLTLNILGDSMGRITKGQINYRIKLMIIYRKLLKREIGVQNSSIAVNITVAS